MKLHLLYPRNKVGAITVINGGVECDLKVLETFITDGLCLSSLTPGEV